MAHCTRRTDWHNLSAKVPKSSSPFISGMLMSLTSHDGVFGRDTSACSPRCIVVAGCCWVWQRFATRGVQDASRISGAGVPASWLSWQPPPSADLFLHVFHEAWGICQISFECSLQNILIVMLVVISIEHVAKHRLGSIHSCMSAFFSRISCS